MLFRMGSLGLLGMSAGLAACGAPPTSASTEVVTVQQPAGDFVLLQIVTSPPSLVPPELASLVATAKDISSVYSGITDAIKILQILGIIPTDPSAAELFQQLEMDLNRIGAAVYDGDVANTRVITLAPALAAATDADRAAAHGQTLPEFLDDDTNSQAAVQAAGMPPLFQRLYVESTTNGNTGWKNVIADRPNHASGTVYDWRLNIPHLMYTIGLRLKVMSAIHPNWRVDGWFDGELAQYRDILKAQLTTMLGELHCNWQKNFTWLFSGDGPTVFQDSETVACADINTGISASQTIAQGFLDVGQCTSCYSNEDGSSNCTTDRACVDADTSYNTALQQTIDQVQQSLYHQVEQQLPIFALRSLIDTLNLYVSHSPDLTAENRRVPLEQARNLCLSASGPLVAGAPLVVLSCDGSASESWVYDRRAGTVSNPATGKCADVRAASATAGSAVQLWDCNGGINQQWTYDPVTHVLESALGMALDVQSGALQAGTPAWIWWRNEGAAQQWHADGARVTIEVSPPSACGTFNAGEGLSSGSFGRSCDGRFVLSFSADGNLALDQQITFNPRPPPPAPTGASARLWQSNTSGFLGQTLVMQGDGNLVLYDTMGAPYWASNTAGNPGAFSVIQNDGNLVVYSVANRPLWSTNTCCH